MRWFHAIVVGAALATGLAQPLRAECVSFELCCQDYADALTRAGAADTDVQAADQACRAALPTDPRTYLCLEALRTISQTVQQAVARGVLASPPESCMAGPDEAPDLAQ